MSILKSELKQLVTHEIGVRVDDALDGARRELHALEGRQTAFMDSAKAVELLLGHVDKDVTEEKYDLTVAEQVKKYLVRASNVLQNLSRESTNMVIAQTGKVQGFAHTVALLKGMIDAEKAKAVALVVPEVPVAHPAGSGEEGRPSSIKALRLAEEAKEAPRAQEALKEQNPLGRGGRPRAKNS